MRCLKSRWGATECSVSRGQPRARRSTKLLLSCKQSPVNPKINCQPELSGICRPSFVCCSPHALHVAVFTTSMLPHTLGWARATTPAQCDFWFSAFPQGANSCQDQPERSRDGLSSSGGSHVDVHAVARLNCPATPSQIAKSHHSQPPIRFDTPEPERTLT